jgi:hypothetical protein
LIYKVWPAMARAYESATGDLAELWHAVTLASIGREAEAVPIFKQVFAKEPVWADLLVRLLIARIRALAPPRQQD